MIKFIENSDTKLKFVSYPILKFWSFLLVLIIFIPLLYWFFLSSSSSSLNCQRTFLNRVDCQLQESSLLNLNVTQTDIINLRKVDLFTFRRGIIALKANPNYHRNFGLSSIIGFQAT